MKTIKVVGLSALLLSFSLTGNAFADTPTCDGVIKLQSLDGATLPQKVRTYQYNYSGLIGQTNSDITSTAFVDNMTIFSYSVLAGTGFSFSLNIYADDDNSAPACTFEFNYLLASGICKINPYVSTIKQPISSNRYTCTAGDPEDVNTSYGPVLRIGKNPT